MKKRGKPRKTERNKIMAEMYLNGLKRKKTKVWSCKDLGLAFGISESQAYRILKRELEELHVDNPFKRKRKGLDTTI